MTATATIVLSSISTGIGVIGVLRAMLRILTTNVTRELQTGANRISELKTDLGGGSTRPTGGSTASRPKCTSGSTASVKSSGRTASAWPSSKERSRVPSRTPRPGRSVNERGIAPFGLSMARVRRERWWRATSQVSASAGAWLRLRMPARFRSIASLKASSSGMSRWIFQQPSSAPRQPRRPRCRARRLGARRQR